MKFKDVLKRRQSIREFKDTDIPDKKIRKMLRLAGLAPSAGNRQAFRVVIAKKRLTSINSPVQLVVCAVPEESGVKYGDRGRNLYSMQDATIFAAYLQLVITDMGLASVWIGAIKEGSIRQELGLDANLRPIAIIALGYPAMEKSGKRRRKSLEQIIWKKNE